MRWSWHDRGTSPGREGVGARPHRGLALLFGDIMAAKKRPAPRKKAKASDAVYPTSAVSIAARNLLNMAVVMASCATILLALMIVKKF
ncbi:MAG: hypothetical protein JWP84_2266 [Tardiphaga sp.]|nr:hypothetical protein [Tardiphaga sp.]